MEQLANRVGASLATQLGLSEERQEIVAFGALSLLQNGTTLVASMAAGALAGVLPEVTVAMVTAATLRHVSGGVHLSTPWRCIIATTLLFVIEGLGGAWAFQALLPHRLLWYMSLLLLLAAGLIPVLRYAPVAADTRPLSAGHRAKLRRKALWLAPLMAALFGAAGVLRAWWALSGLFAFAFQGLTLMSPGRRFIHLIDTMPDR